MRGVRAKSDQEPGSLWLVGVFFLPICFMINDFPPFKYQESASKTLYSLDAWLAQQLSICLWLRA